MIVSTYHKNVFCFRHIIVNTLYRTTTQLAEGIMVDLCRDFWIHATGTGQQVAQLHERYDDDDHDDHDDHDDDPA